jgi:hypothetical protein
MTDRARHAPPSWAEPCRRGSRRLDLETAVVAARVRRWREADRRWYGPGGVKARLCALVGRLVDDPVLGSSAADDAADGTLYGRLRHGRGPHDPDAKGCGR